jgi:hypothetical protein
VSKVINFPMDRVRTAGESGSLAQVIPLRKKQVVLDPDQEYPLKDDYQAELLALNSEENIKLYWKT